MIIIQQMTLPYRVIIPVSLENSRDSEWYNRLRNWLQTNLKHYCVAESDAFVVIVQVEDEVSAQMLKLAYQSGEPLEHEDRYREVKWQMVDNSETIENNC